MASLENLSTHRSPRVAASLHQQACWFVLGEIVPRTASSSLELLPPYSPDLKPIEIAFSKLKVHLRRLKARSFERILKTAGSICNLFTSTECENYLHAADYAPG